MNLQIERGISINGQQENQWKMTDAVQPVKQVCSVAVAVRVSG